MWPGALTVAINVLLEFEQQLIGVETKKEPPWRQPTIRVFLCMIPLETSIGGLTWKLPAVGSGGLFLAQ